jgi:hypothetical protein
MFSGRSFRPIALALAGAALLGCTDAADGTSLGPDVVATGGAVGQRGCNRSPRADTPGSCLATRPAPAPRTVPHTEPRR